MLDADPASVIALSPDGTLFATGNQKGIVKVWDAATLTQRNTFSAGDGLILELAFTSRPDELAIGFGIPYDFRSNKNLPDQRKATSDYYDAKTGKPSAVASRMEISNRVLRWPGRVNDYEVKYNPNGTRQIQGVRDHKPVGQPFTTKRNVSQFAISPDGRTLATLSDKLELWSVETGLPTCPPLGAHTRENISGGITFSPDGRWLLEYDGRYKEGGLQVWDAATGKPHGKIFPKASWAPYPVLSQSCRLAMTVPDSGKGAQIWDVEKSEARGARLVTDGNIRSFVFSADEKLAATVSSDNVVRVWSTEDGKLLCRVAQPQVEAVAFHPDGKHLLLAGAGLRVHALPMGGQAKRPFREWAKVPAMQFSPRNEVVVVNGETHELEIFAANAAPADPPKWHRPFSGDHATFAFSDDGSVLVAADEPGQVKFWRMADGSAAGAAVSPKDPIFAAALSHDMRTFAGAGEDNVIRLWDVATGKPVKELKSPPMQAAWMELQFSPDDRFLGARCSMIAWEFWEIASARHFDRKGKDHVFAL
ncbi:MAG: WD40 repeat domain-containing protein, partial [Chthoniobacteraceae bacterium]